MFNLVNCWNPLRAFAPKVEQRKGLGNQQPSHVCRHTRRVTWKVQRLVGDERIPGHECQTRKGRYSLNYHESGRCTDKEPCDNILNSIPYSGKLEDLAKFSVRKPVMQALRNDAKKTFDRAAYAQFYLTPLRVGPTGGTASNSVYTTTNGTATGTTSIAYSNLHAKAIVDVMKERNIPAYVGDDYMAIAWPTTLRTFKNNLESLHQYTESGIKLIFNGEIGRYENVRYVEQTNVIKNAGSTDGATGGAAWPGSSISGWIFFFGEDTVMEGVVQPEEIRAKIPTDYGRSKGVAWYYEGGLGLTHTNAVQARVVMWDSAT